MNEALSVVHAPQPSRPGQRADALAVLQHLSSAGDLLCDAAADSLRQILCGESDPGEAEWVRRIEAHRGALEASSEEIQVALPYPGAKDRRSTVGEICRRRSKGRLWGLFLHKLVRELGPMSVLEMGTCLGVSTAYQASALERNRRGRMVSLEGAQALASTAAAGLCGLGLTRVRIRSGLFQDTLEPTLHEMQRPDFVFIDGHHDEHATLAYFERILPFLAPRAMLVFDDIAWSEGMVRAWRALEADPRVAVTLDLATVGVCLVGANLPRLRFAFPPLSRIMAGERLPDVRRAATELLPPGASVLVVSRGDERLLELEGIRAGHFPQTEGGTYAGHHPADSQEAITHLERLRRGGAEFVLFPSTAFWWLEYYAGLRAYLERQGHAIHRDESCAIYRLAGA